MSTRQRRQFEAEIDIPKPMGWFSYGAAVLLIDMILRVALSRTIDDLDDWIDEKVPKRTGQLRDSLKKNLRTSRVIKGQLLKLYFGTHLNYADFVNDMTTSQVAHSNEPGYAYYYGNYGKITLDDPNAIGGFFDEMIVFAKKTLSFHIKFAIQNFRFFQNRIQSLNLINYVVVRRT